MLITKKLLTHEASYKPCARLTNSETGIASFEVVTIAPGFPLAGAAAIPLEIAGPVR